MDDGWGDGSVVVTCSTAGCLNEPEPGSDRCADCQPGGRRSMVVRDRTITVPDRIDDDQEPDDLDFDFDGQDLESDTDFLSDSLEGDVETSQADSEAEVRPGRGRAGWTQERCVEAARAWGAQHGRAPSQRDARDDPLLPSPSTAHTYCGSWANMIEQAGFERPRRGGGRSRKPEKRRVQHAAGETAVAPARSPIGWIRVPGTGLSYRTSLEAYVAADEIEADGERVARDSRVAGDEARAEVAVERACALAEAVRAAARAADGEPEPAPVVAPAAPKHPQTDMGRAAERCDEAWRQLEATRGAHENAKRELADALAAMRLLIVDYEDAAS